MPRRADISSLLVLAGLSACATVEPRLYSEAELARVADKCGVADTEVAQMGTNIELLYLLTPYPSDEQLVCAARWARRHGFRLVYVDVAVPEPEPEPVAP